MVAGPYAAAYMSRASEIDFGREAFKGVTAKFLMYLFGFAATAYFARVLGPVSFGGYLLLLSIVAFINRVPQGIGGACQKRLSEVNAPTGELLGVVIGTTAIVGVVAGVAAILTGDRMVAYTGLDDAAFLAWFLVTAISLYVPLLLLLCGKGRFGDKEWVELGRDVLERPMQLVLVVIGLGATGMALGRVGATVVCLPLLIYLLAIKPAIPSRATLASVWEFARPNIASNIVGKAYTRFDIFLLGFAGATAAVGFYEVALVLTQLGAVISGVVMAGLLSKVSALDSQRRPVTDAVETTLSYTSSIAIPQFVLVLILGAPIVRTVYGAEYTAAIPFVLGLAFYRIVQAQRETLDSTVKGLDRPDLVFQSTTVAVTLNFLIGVPLLVYHGPTGVVLATVLAELLRWGLLHRAIAREGHRVSTIPVALRKQTGSALLMGGIVVIALRNTTGPLTPTRVGGLVLLGAATYIVALVAVDDTVQRGVRTRFLDVHTAIADAISPSCREIGDR